MKAMLVNLAFIWLGVMLGIVISALMGANGGRSE